MASIPRRKTIVISGCSSGFGRQTALHLVKEGWHVFATVRKEADRDTLLAEIADQDTGKLSVLTCDITQPEQVTTLAQAVTSEISELDALLNNAGTAFAGPLELLSLEDFRAQMEINVVAHIGMIQAFLPLLKSARGTIINVSSVNGRVATPLVGAYAASKYALEAISDALRVELAPFGVRVVVIEPSSSPTGIWATSQQRATAKLEEQREGPYKRLLNTFEKIVSRAGKSGFPPQLFADTVQSILSTRRPRTRYVIPTSARWAILARQILPDKLWDRQVRRSLRW